MYGRTVQIEGRVELDICVGGECMFNVLKLMKNGKAVGLYGIPIEFPKTEKES